MKITMLYHVINATWKTDQSSVCGRGVRLRAGGDLEQGNSTARKFTQRFTKFYV